MSEIFRWASLNGAMFLGKENELGSLSKGKKPGIVLVKGLDKEGCVTGESTAERIV